MISSGVHRNLSWELDFFDRKCGMRDYCSEVRGHPPPEKFYKIAPKIKHFLVFWNTVFANACMDFC